ncbi:dolichyl-phosphate beta-glucosyltransferase [Bifidobacterium sp. ESL0790]|uniref:dolichyl-phosphate beta-glucosyltransferase n=1 Tax=Bifidobacterium sp. ESL0790 TaxID=2983233 RepID=UPI0023FA02EA|nr:dolichyl-phosphate beta-glucosyltransferase [Bifidobacterium sp. ESL0790]WEV72281.1 glycosyltransferase family 2 protein [Bifidobacterium sp. ESL0790]
MGKSQSAQRLNVIADRVGRPHEVDADIVIPVYNESEQLADSVRTLMDYLERSARERRDGAGYTWNIVIADNASTDGTWPIAVYLARQYPQRVRAIRIAAKGRGRALKLAWGESRASVRAYMDVDLSTDIRCADVLIHSILDGPAEVATGCRLLDESQVDRSPKREFISRCYNVLLRATLGADFQDAQCGFKAISASAARFLLPRIQDDEWFFDTELLTLAQAYGLPTYIFPVRWVEDAGTTVDIPDTARKDIEGMMRMRHVLGSLEERRLVDDAKRHDALADQVTKAGKSSALFPRSCRIPVARHTWISPQGARHLAVQR